MIEEFLERVFDLHFVANKRYAELLVSEIPSAKKTDVLIEIFRNRDRGTHENLKYITDEITGRLSEEEIDIFMGAFSDELKNCNNDFDMMSAISFIPKFYWSKIKETTKMRIENILIGPISQGRCDTVTNDVYDGFDGTWAMGIVRYFSLVSEIQKVFLEKLISPDIEEAAYVIYFFLYDLPIIFSSKTHMMIAGKSMRKLVKAGNSGIRPRLVDFLNTCPSDWKNEILRQFDDLTDQENPEFWIGDLTPFLGKLPKEDDDLPF